MNNSHNFLTKSLFIVFSVATLLLISQVYFQGYDLSISENVLGHSADTLDNLVGGEVFIRSSGSSSVTVQASAGFDDWESQYQIIDPAGNSFAKITKNPSDGAFANVHVLSLSGDHLFTPTLQHREYSITSTAQMSIEPSKNKTTFRGINEGHSASKLYFFVPDGTTEFTFYALMTAGDADLANEAILYDETDTTHTTLALDMGGSGEYQVKSVTVNSPNSGFWSASINVESATNDSAGTFWVEGVPNYFATTTTDWFEPILNSASVSITVDHENIIGTRGLIGAGKVYETAAPPAAIKDAFLDIGLEANEVELLHTSTEDPNDDGDVNNINLAGFDFTYQGVDYTKSTLLAEPVITFRDAAAWLVGALGYSCNDTSDSDCKLQDSSVHAEWSEFIAGVLQNYNVTSSYGLKYISVVDQPNLETIPAADLATLFNTVRSRISIHSDSSVVAVKPFSGAVSGLDSTAQGYLDTVISAVTASEHDVIGLNVYDLGYAGGGNLFSTPYIKSILDSKGASADATGGTTPKKFLQLRVNSSDEDGINQNADYYNSFDHAVWWWSYLVNSINSGKSEAILYSPFEDDGTTDGIRGMVKSDGTYKPVAYGTKFLLTNSLSSVVSSTVTNSTEVESLVLNDGVNYKVFLVNKTSRNQNASLSFTFPEDKIITWSGEYISASSYVAPTTITGESGLEVTTSGWDLQVSLSGESLTVITLSIETLICSPNWSCTAWGACDGTNETRTCTDQNSCGDNTNKPVETRSCSCTPSWSCTGWSSCINDFQTRSCTDSSQCGDNTNKPAEQRSCTSVCNPLWSCTDWSPCLDNFTQVRECSDINFCDTTDNKPREQRECIQCKPNWLCEDWSACTDGVRTRTCNDLEQCGVSIDRPALEEQCNIPTDTDSEEDQAGGLDPGVITVLVIGAVGILPVLAIILYFIREQHLANRKNKAAPKSSQNSKN